METEARVSGNHGCVIANTVSIIIFRISCANSCLWKSITREKKKNERRVVQRGGISRLSEE